MARDAIAGPEGGPEQPFPIRTYGRIIKGFGRGSKELGIPTANLPIEGLSIGGHSDIESGIYFGWAGLDLASSTSDSGKALAPSGSESNNGHIKEKAEHAIGEAVDALVGSSKDPILQTEKRPSQPGQDIYVYPMVASIGYNPYYKNEKRTVEVHIIHQFHEDFYNALMNLSVTGFIRHEKDYDSMDALIDDIKTDILVAGRSLERPAYAKLAKDPYLTDFTWATESE